MKSLRFPLLTAGLLTAALGTAQTLHTITFDLATKDQVDLSALEDIKKGDQYRVEVMNVNMNLYKITVNGKDSSSASAVKFPGFGDFGIDAITSLVGGVGSVIAKVTAAAEAFDRDPSRVREDASTAKGFKELKGAIDEYNKKHFTQPLFVIDIEDLKEDPVKDKLNKYSAEIGQRATDILSLKTRIDNLLMKVQLRMLQLKSVSAPGAATIDYPTTLTQIQDLRNDLQSLQNAIMVEQKGHAAYVADDKIKKVIEADKEIKELNENVTSGFTKLVTGVAEALASIDATKSSALLEALQLLEANADRTYRSAAYTYKGGDATASLSITPLKPEYNLQTYSTTFNFPLKNRTYVGVSAGFYAAGLYNDAFSTRSQTNITATDTSDVYYLVDEKSVRNEIGAAALFTYGTKWKDDSCFGLQFVLGPGVSITDKVRPRLLVGGGFSLGREHMVLVNGGLVAGYVDRKTAALAEDGPFGGEPGSTTVVRLDGSWFISLGYLFKF